MGQKNYALDAQLTNAANSAVIGAKEQQVRDTQAQVEGDRKSAVIQFVGGMAASATGLGLGYTGRKWRDSPSETTEAYKYDQAVKANPAAHDAAIETFTKAYKEARGRGIGPNEDRTIQSFDAYLKKEVTDNKSSDPGALKRHAANFLSERNFFTKKMEQIANNRVSYGGALDGSAQSVAQLTNQAVGLTDRFSGGQYERDQASIALKVDDVNVSIAQQVLDSAKSRQDRDLQDVDKGIDALKDMMSRYAGLADKW